MADVTLGDYTGYIFLEMVRARQMADAYSQAVAQEYASDDVRQHFSVPRFKIPKMQLTIPVLVSGAHFQQTVKFDFPIDQFLSSVNNIASDVRSTVQQKQTGALPKTMIVASTGVEMLARDFHQQLVGNSEPLRPDTIVTVMWARIFRQTLGEARLLEFYEMSDPAHALLARSTTQVLDLVHTRTVVQHTALEDLLVNPETNIVKNGSSESSVFTITAELVEEGFYLHYVQEEGQTERHAIVDFE